MRRLQGGLFLAALLACLLPAGAAPAGSPSTLLAAIRAAAGYERSVRYTSVANYGTEQLSFVGVAGLDAGSQEITYRKSGKTGHVTVIVAGDNAYVRGDAFTLQNYMGFKSAAATAYAGQWVRFPKNDKGYPVVAAGVKMGSVVDEIGLKGTLSRPPKSRIGGQDVIAVRGTQSGGGRTIVDTIYAQAKGAPLPVKEITTEGNLSLVTTWGNWNDGVDIGAPKGSVSIVVVRTTAPGPVA